MVDLIPNTPEIARFRARLEAAPEGKLSTHDLRDFTLLSFADERPSKRKVAQMISTLRGSLWRQAEAVYATLGSEIADTFFTDPNTRAAWLSARGAREDLFMDHLSGVIDRGLKVLGARYFPDAKSWKHRHLAGYAIIMAVDADESVRKSLKQESQYRRGLSQKCFDTLETLRGAHDNGRTATPLSQRANELFFSQAASELFGDCHLLNEEIRALSGKRRGDKAVAEQSGIMGESKEVRSSRLRERHRAGTGMSSAVVAKRNKAIAATKNRQRGSLKSVDEENTELMRLWRKHVHDHGVHKGKPKWGEIAKEFSVFTGIQYTRNGVFSLFQARFPESRSS